jgi:hypothetical protein
MKVIIMFFTVELHVGDAVLELALLVDHVLQAARGVFQRALVDRAGDQVLHGGDLAAHPAVVVQQFADVLEQQLEQAQQQLLLFADVAALQFDLVAQFFQAPAISCSAASPCATLDGGAQRFGFGASGLAGSSEATAKPGCG